MQLKAGNSWKIALMKTLLTTCDCDSFATYVMRDYQYYAWHLAGRMVSLAFGNNTQSKKFWVEKKSNLWKTGKHFFYHPLGWERNFLKKMLCTKVRLFFSAPLRPYRVRKKNLSSAGLARTGHRDLIWPYARSYPAKTQSIWPNKYKYAFAYLLERVWVWLHSLNM